ncbi:MAG: hypothetical protein ACKO3W_03935, partial [bacterium]
MNATLLTLFLGALPTILGQATPSTSTPPERASETLSERAQEQASEQTSTIPDPPAHATPEAVYNAGVARFRAGDFSGAGELFARAATGSRASTAARSLYNRGTSRYVETVPALQAAMQSAQGAPASPLASPTATPNPEQLIASLEAALRDLKDAARADATNVDARANAELVHRVLKQLKQQQEQQKQDQQQQDQQKQDQQKQD